MSAHGHHHQGLSSSHEDHPIKRQRTNHEQAPCSPNFEESKVNVWVVQPLIHGNNEDSLRNLARSELMDRLPERSTTYAPALSSGNNMTQTHSVAAGDDSLWQLGMFALTDRNADASSMAHHHEANNNNMMSSALADLEPTPMRGQQDEQEQFLLNQQQQYDEDQMQQQILRQIDEQQRQLLQQRQDILQRQQMRLQQRQMQLRQELGETSFSMQQQPPQLQQQHQFSLQQQQPLGMSDNLYPFEEDDQDDRIAALMGFCNQQRDQNQGGFPKHR